MPRPDWDDENKNMHPTCEARDQLTSVSDKAFLSRIKNKDVLSSKDSIQLYDLWHKVGGDEL